MERKTLGQVLLAAGVIAAILLILLKIQTDTQGSFLCELVERDPMLTMAECPAHGSPVEWMLLVLFAISVAVALVGVHLLRAPESHKTEKLDKKPESKSYDLARLSEEEKKIHDLLTANDNSMYQSDLIKETGFSKVKMSRLLDKMYAKGLIERKRRGMTNVVILR